MQLEIRNDAFVINGRQGELLSGEIPYFRVPKSNWKKAMQLWKAAGGNCIASYCPWLVHEPEEGVFRFDEGDGITDISQFLETAAEVGLGVILRPGPYVYSEFRHGGLPRWLVEKYPEILAIDRKGNYIRKGATVTYLHPLFMEKVERYFSHICPIIAKYTAKNGGPVVMLQPDNEIYGLQIWNGDYDFSPAYAQFGEKKGRYPQFLKKKFGTVKAANKRYGTKHGAFTDFSAKDEPSNGHAKWLWSKDWFEFYTQCGDEYIRWLIGLFEKYGAECLYSINSGNAGMNTYFKNIKEEYGDKLLLGSDHYYTLGQEFAQNNPTPQIFMRFWLSMQILRLMGNPPSVLEFQFGTYADWPPCCPEDLEANLKMHLALGMRGFNGYIFAGGPNIKGEGRFTDNYDFCAPVGPDGKPRKAYKILKDFGKLLEKYPELVMDKPVAEVQTYIQNDCMNSSYLWGRLNDDACVEPSSMTWFIQRGIGTTLLSSGIQNIGCNWETVDVRLPLVLPCCGIMSATEQKAVIAFLERGGSILCLPVLPRYDENLEDCTILADYVGAMSGTKQRDAYVSVAGIDNFACGLGFYPIESLPEDASVIGTDGISGKPAAFLKNLPNGAKFVLLGTLWWHTQHEQNLAIENILNMLGLKRHVFTDDQWMFPILNEHSLWLLNLTTSVRTPNVKLSKDGKKFRDLGRIRLKQMSATLITL